MSVTVLLLAAGGSTRMRGGDKLLETLDGEPLLLRSARTALDSRADETVVILGANRRARASALSALPLRMIVNENWREGMGRSIAAGVAALTPGTTAAIVMPADMPDLGCGLLDCLIDALPPDAPDAILRPRTTRGIAGNPVLFGAGHFPALASLSGDGGARRILAENAADLRYVEVAGDGILTDLDTPEAWDRYRMERGASKGN